MDVHKEAPLTSPGSIMGTARSTIMVRKRDGSLVAYDEACLLKTLLFVSHDLLDDAGRNVIVKEVRKTLFEGMTTADIDKALVLAASSSIELDPVYMQVAGRLLRIRLAREVFGVSCKDMTTYERIYRQSFGDQVVRAVAQGLLDKQMLNYDLIRLSNELVIERDDLVGYTGMHTLYERYLLRYRGLRYETVQAFWMRIAMGLALQEKREDREGWAIQFYHTLSRLYYIPSTPTLFHSGLPVAQLSSCYLSTVKDDLHHIFKCLGDNAQLSKWAGGLGVDWTNVRGTGAYIKSIKATSQGVVPYLKIANDVVVAITRSGIRRGGKCAYLECWHFDFEDFLDLRRNTGDDRRRTHDMNTASWVPDLFMQRVQEDGTWTLFCPSEVPDLHGIYGKAFVQRYKYYEALAENGRLAISKKIKAKDLWRKMLTRLFETGHPWITFKDPCNIRSPQDHAGVINSSNLCTEITLNTSESETAVCNLGSLNLARLVDKDGLKRDVVENVVMVAMRMLDNVIDLNFYPTQEARDANLRHRPVGLGLMGFQDALCIMRIPFSDAKALQFADESMELISYCAIKASAQLAKERSPYESFVGSKWDRGIFPFDTLDILAQERGQEIPVSRSSTLDWANLKVFVKQYGMRNSNTMAIAPTATISTIAGSYPSIEPMYNNMYVKSNVSGEFTVINPYLVADLKKLGLWNQDMIDAIKHRDGDISAIEQIPGDIRELYQTAFEIDPVWLVKITAARGKWIDQSQSHNVFMKGVSGKKLHDVYMTGWQYGMKTFYYLRTLAASGIEKSTLDAKVYGFTQKRDQEVVAKSACSIEDPTCESCQ